MTKQELRDLPKVELHCHLDGSLSQEYIEASLQRTVRKEELCVSETCKSLVEYLEKFQLPDMCLQTEAGLEHAGMDVLKQMSKEHVIYAEIRFAPMLSVTKDMGLKEVIAALLRGLEQGKQQYHVSYQVIVCLMRHHTEEQNRAVIEAAKAFLGNGVCALDLAGSEQDYPMEGFVSLFEMAKQEGIPFTLHAGECKNAKNIQDSILVGASRIGHGIAMRNQTFIKNLVKEGKIGIELCPISNLQTKSVDGSEEYPLREFLEEGILVTINTDNRTVSDTCLTKEFAFIQDKYAITDEEILQLIYHAIAVTFLPDEEKKRLRKLVEQHIQSMRK